MTDIEIPREQWPDCYQTFSLEHHGWLVNIQVVDTKQLGSDRLSAITNGRVLAIEQPLQQVSETSKNNTVDLTVTVGSELDKTSFLIEGVARLFRERMDSAHKGLRIDSDDGTTTLVEFRVAAKPEALDGLAESEM